MSNTEASNKSIKKIAPVAAVAFVATMLVGGFSFTTIAYAAVTFDPESGKGFVGKGDVQEVLGWNNKQLQQGASSLEFTFVSETVSEVSWECTNDRNENIQERERTTTTETSGVVSSIARERNQITGFNLDGFKSTETGDPVTEGPQVNSCPSGPWSLTTAAGDPDVSTTGTLFVNGEELAEF
jgi:hypothetical protein